MLRRLLFTAAALLALTGLAREVRSAILYPCGCSEYYVKTCQDCPTTLPCAEERCSRTKTWQNAACKQQRDSGTCIVNTEQPGFQNTFEDFGFCSEDGECHCPVVDPTVTATPVTVSVLANGTTPCPALQCNQNRNCNPR